MALIVCRRDTSLSAQHGMVIVAMVAILRSLGSASKSLPFLPVVMPLLLHTSCSDDEQLRVIAIEQLGYLVKIMDLHVRGYVPALLALVCEHLHSPSGVGVHCISVLEQLCVALCDEFQQYLPPLMPQLLAIMHKDRTEQRLQTMKVLNAIKVFDQNMQDHLHLVVPAVLRLCEQHGTPSHVRQRAVSLVGWLCARLDLREYLSQLMHAMIQVLREAQVIPPAIRSGCYLPLPPPVALSLMSQWQHRNDCCTVHWAGEERA